MSTHGHTGLKRFALGSVTENLVRHAPCPVLVVRERQHEFLKRLCSFIKREFRASEAGELTPVGPGLYGEGRFYQANSKFYFPKTCNYWTASALRSAGCPIRPLTSVAAGHVMSKTKKIGLPIQEK